VCGIGGFVCFAGSRARPSARVLAAMSELLAHRGPDGHGEWISPDGRVGLCHQRLAIIDLSDDAAQPMTGEDGSKIVFNGEIYNYRDLRERFSRDGRVFRSRSDTETILAAYEKSGTSCVDDLRGMFAFAIWDERRNRLVLARDRFGIKPLYYTVQDGVLYFASETKALLPFLPAISTNRTALAEYLTFQYTIGEDTLFDGISQLMPGHIMVVTPDAIKIDRYWDVCYEVEFGKPLEHWVEGLRSHLNDSVGLHLVSDVGVGSYLSGGIDSSLIAVLASKTKGYAGRGFHGRFTEFPGYDESDFAHYAAVASDSTLTVRDITAEDFEANIRSVIYHLDHPVAGPGSFPQYMVSETAAREVRVVLGGQGGDEIFGGYARYLVAYLEQCIKAAIDGTYRNGNYVVTIESIIPNMGILREYTPLLQEFWREGLFGPLDERFFRLIDRSSDITDEIEWADLDIVGVKNRFLGIFNSTSNVSKEAYFDSMTHFEFKTLLPALLQVEDRMSMAHGLESRVPLLDHPLVEFMATVPADVKFEGGKLKNLLKVAYTDEVPHEILERRDKMGFPVPLREWFNGDLADFVQEVMAEGRSRRREYVNHDAVLRNFRSGSRFSRKTWALLSLELWQQEFHDKASQYRSLVK
jgi:asparagine synthase (glutamine-hydrolysing)